MLSAPPPVDEDETTRKLLNDLWQRLLPQTAARLHLLDQAVEAAANHDLTPALQAQAAATAHKFAGSLGMFGYHEGSRLALSLEEYLDTSMLDASGLAILIHELRRSLLEPSASSLSDSSNATDQATKHLIES